MAKLNFRKVRKTDLNNLGEIRGENINNLHLERLENQKKKFLTYLIAFDGNEPIGYILITYKNFHSWHKCPALEDLYVKESARQKGFAKQIMKYAESLVKKKGHNKICLDVETHEKWIRKFYESLGYKKISGVHKLTYAYEKEGKLVSHVEWVNYFEKLL